MDKHIRNSKLAAFIFYWFAFIVLGSIAYAVLLFIYPNDDQELLRSSIMNFVVYLLIFVMFIFILWRYYKKEFIDFKNNIVKYTTLAASIWFMAFVANYVYNAILIITKTSDTPENQELLNESFINTAYLVIPMVVLFAPLIEETIFRGIIFDFFKKLKLPSNLNIILAFIFSTVIFGGIHFATELNLIGILNGVPYLILGFAICLVYYLTDNLFAAIVIHGIQNLVSVIMLLIVMFIEGFTGQEIATQFINFIFLI